MVFVVILRSRDPQKPIEKTMFLIVTIITIVDETMLSKGISIQFHCSLLDSILYFRSPNERCPYLGAVDVSGAEFGVVWKSITRLFKRHQNQLRRHSWRREKGVSFRGPPKSIFVSNSRCSRHQYPLSPTRSQAPIDLVNCAHLLRHVS